MSATTIVTKRGPILLLLSTSILILPVLLQASTTTLIALSTFAFGFLLTVHDVSNDLYDSLASSYLRFRNDSLTNDNTNDNTKNEKEGGIVLDDLLLRTVFYLQSTISSILGTVCLYFIPEKICGRERRVEIIKGFLHPLLVDDDGDGGEDAVEKVFSSPGGIWSVVPDEWIRWADRFFSVDDRNCCEEDGMLEDEYEEEEDGRVFRDEEEEEGDDYEYEYDYDEMEIELHDDPTDGIRRDDDDDDDMKWDHEKDGEPLPSDGMACSSTTASTFSEERQERPHVGTEQYRQQKNQQRPRRRSRPKGPSRIYAEIIRDVRRIYLPSALRRITEKHVRNVGMASALALAFQLKKSPRSRHVASNVLHGSCMMVLCGLSVGSFGLLEFVRAIRFQLDDLQSFDGEGEERCDYTDGNVPTMAMMENGNRYSVEGGNETNVMTRTVTSPFRMLEKLYDRFGNDAVFRRRVQGIVALLVCHHFRRRKSMGYFGSGSRINGGRRYRNKII